MPVTYEIDARNSVIRTRCTGYVTLPEVLDHFRELASSPRPTELDVLLDLRSSTSLPTDDQLRKVSEAIQGVRERVRFGSCAIVAPQDPMYGTAMIFEVFAARGFRESRVFRDVDEAEYWLSGRRSYEVN